MLIFPLPFFLLFIIEQQKWDAPQAAKESFKCCLVVFISSLMSLLAMDIKILLFIIIMQNIRIVTRPRRITLKVSS